MGGAGRGGLGEFETVMVAVTGAGGGVWCWWAAPSFWVDGGNAAGFGASCTGGGISLGLSGLGGSAWSTISTSCVGEAAMVLAGERASRSRRPGDCETRDGDRAAGVGLVGDHPSDGVAGAHS